jgi:UDP-N-acetylglucosamine 2-epimerase
LVTEERFTGCHEGESDAEWGEMVEAGWNVLVGWQSERILEAAPVKI